jgi:hypothetical protein
MEQLRVLAGEPLLVIDFRYHLVSLIAVFLAIALGIIIGTTALNQPILNDIEGQVAALEQDKRSLEDRTQSLQVQLDAGQAFDAAVGPALVEGTLTGRSVLVVVTNDAVLQDDVDAVTALIGEAGGTVSGQISLQPEYTDPSSEAALQSYVTSGLPSGVTVPEADDAGQLVGALLAQVLMIGPNTPEPDPAAISSVMAGLSALDVLSQDSDSIAPADYAVVVTADAFTGDDAATRNGTLVDLVSALDAAGSGAVVAGNAASAADDVDVVAGQISTVLALSQEGEGTSGKYGTGEDTQPVPPVPATAP